MSRLRFPYFLVALLATSVALAACGGDSDESDESAQAVLDEATFQGMESGILNLSTFITTRSEGEESVAVFTLSGPYRDRGREANPELDLVANVNGSFNGEDVHFEGGLVLLPNTAYVRYEGTTYKVDPTTLSFVESTLKRGQRDREGGGLTECQEAASELEVSDFVDNVTTVGRINVGGTVTNKVTGDLDVPDAIDALLEIAESDACRAQLTPALELPSEAEVDNVKREAERSVKAAHLTVYAGDDHIIREILLRVGIRPEDASSGPQHIEIALDTLMIRVNEEQKISTPRNAKPLSELFLKLDVNPIELLGLLQGEEGGKSLGELFEGLGMPNGLAG